MQQRHLPGECEKWKLGSPTHYLHSHSVLFWEICDYESYVKEKKKALLQKACVLSSLPIEVEA